MQKLEDFKEIALQRLEDELVRIRPKLQKEILIDYPLDPNYYNSVNLDPFYIFPDCRTKEDFDDKFDNLYSKSCKTNVEGYFTGVKNDYFYYCDQVDIGLEIIENPRTTRRKRKDQYVSSIVNLGFSVPGYEHLEREENLLDHNAFLMGKAGGWSGGATGHLAHLWYNEEDYQNHIKKRRGIQRSTW